MDVDCVYERSISFSRGLEVIRVLESLGIRCINSLETAEISGNKIATTLALKKANVPQPEVRFAFTEESALKAIDELGYPCVVKPVNLSASRGVIRANNREELLKAIQRIQPIVATLPDEEARCDVDAVKARIVASGLS